MRDDLDEPIRRALNDARLDLAIEFTHAADRKQSGTVVLRDADGKPVAEVPLDTPEAMNVVSRANRPSSAFGTPFPRHGSIHRRRRRGRAGPQVEASVLVAGVDGYRRGWVAVSLDPSGDVELSTHVKFAEVVRFAPR